jgi:hypothetical protein
MMTRYAALSLLLASVTSPLLANSDWLPPEVKEAMIVELAKGLGGVDFGSEAKPEEILAAATLGVGDIMQRLERDGVDALIENAPVFTDIALPATDNRHARAMAAYGICSVTLHPELAKDSEERFFVAFGIVTVVIVSAFLRDGHLAIGGTDETLKKYLTSKALEKVGFEVQKDQELRDKISMQCGPILAGLLG